MEAFEGGAEFVAEKDGKFYLIQDARTMTDFIPEDDEDLLGKLLTVLEFDSEDESNDYIRHRKKGENKTGASERKNRVCAGASTRKSTGLRAKNTPHSRPNKSGKNAT